MKSFSLNIFGSDRSPRRGDLVCPSVSDILQNNSENEFYKHSKESRGVFGQVSRQAGKQASRQASKQVSKEASKQAGKQ